MIGTVGAVRSPDRVLVSALVATVLVAACGSDDPGDGEVGGEVTAAATTVDDTAPASSEIAGTSEQQFPDIVDASATLTNEAWTFLVTVSSPYDSPERYADGWRILGPDGTEYGFRLLTHDHASEQPFTRSLSDVQIPADVDVVTIEGRDRLNGFGGGTFELSMSGG